MKEKSEALTNIAVGGANRQLFDAAKKSFRRGCIDSTQEADQEEEGGQ
jgi:hypothetical protein